MKTRMLLISITFLASALLALPASQAAGTGMKSKPEFVAYASCSNLKPFRSADSCEYDRPNHFHATFVAQSNTGNRMVKACFRIYGGPPLGGMSTCTIPGAMTNKVFPFRIDGCQQAFRVRFTLLATSVQSPTEFRAVSSTIMRVTP